MTLRPEFAVLGATLLLALAHILIAGAARTRQYGRRWNMGARDAAMPPLGPLPARLLRAQANLFETLPLFVGALLGAAVAGRLGWKTALGAYLYLGGRIVYLPLYAAGVPVVRTLAWGIATGGIVLIVAALLLG